MRPRSGPRLLAKGKGYIIRYTDEAGNRRERRVNATNLGDAKREEAAFILAHAGNKRRSDTLEPEDYPISTALHNYVVEHGVNTANPTSLAAYIDALAGFWGNLYIGDIRPHTCRDYLAYRLRTGKSCRKDSKGKPMKLSPSTVRRELVTLRAAINHERKEGRVKYVPFVWLPDESKERERWLTREEVAKLLWAARTRKAHDYLPRFILIALYTGARKTAILTLKWEQIDLQSGIINFNDPKIRQTNKRRAIIFAPPGLLWFLKRWHRRSESDYVVSIGSEPMLDIKSGFRNAAARAGLLDVTPHTLRHTTGTWLKAAGHNKEEIGDYLGHKSERTTAKYVHTKPEWLRHVAMSLHTALRQKYDSFGGGFGGGKRKPKKLTR